MRLVGWRRTCISRALWGRKVRCRWVRVQLLLHDSCAYSTGRRRESGRRSQRVYCTWHSIVFPSYSKYYSLLPSRSFVSLQSTAPAPTNPSSSLFPIPSHSLEVPAASAHPQHHPTYFVLYYPYYTILYSTILTYKASTLFRAPGRRIPSRLSPFQSPHKTHHPPSGQRPKHQRPIAPSPWHTNKPVRRAPSPGLACSCRARATQLQGVCGADYWLRPAQLLP